MEIIVGLPSTFWSSTSKLYEIRFQFRMLLWLQPTYRDEPVVWKRFRLFRLMRFPLIGVCSSKRSIAFRPFTRTLTWCQAVISLNSVCKGSFKIWFSKKKRMHQIMITFLEKSYVVNAIYTSIHVDLAVFSASLDPNWSRFFQRTFWVKS